MSSPNLVIPAGVAGLTKADFGFRFYKDGVADTATVAALTITELAGGDYRVNGLPAVGKGNWYTLTWEYPAGAGFSYLYPNQKGAPTNLVLPVREAGLVAVDLSLALYKDGVAQADALTVSELGSPGDYKASGWPRDEVGHWSLVWRRAGVSYSYAWEVEETVDTGILDELADMFPDNFIAQYGTRDAFGGWTASGSAVNVKAYIEGESRLVRDITGREVVSSVQVYILGAKGFNTEDYRYTLPSRFSPRVEVQAVAVGKDSDENGAHHEVVFLP